MQTKVLIGIKGEKFSASKEKSNFVENKLVVDNVSENCGILINGTNYPQIINYTDGRSLRLSPRAKELIPNSSLIDKSKLPIGVTLKNK